MSSETHGRQKRRPKILFVCFADSPHSQSWMSLLRDSEFEVRVFASPIPASDMFPPQPWSFPTYSVMQPDRRGLPTGQVKWLLPKSWRLRHLTGWAQQRFSLASRWLARVISTWKPDILHTLRLNPEGGLTWDALQNVRAAARPKWVMSAWGQELNIDIDDPHVRERVVKALRDCDGFTADCRRDLRKAVALGLSPSKIAVEDPVPGNGGVDLNDFAAGRESDGRRDLILVAKAFESINHKAMCTVEALQLAGDALGGYEVHLSMCSWEVEMWLRRTPESFQRRCHVHKTMPKDEYLALVKRARTVIGTSLSDGTPIVMLDSMAAGALPLMSPLDSIQEWIEDGSNGLLAPALQADRIAAALRRSLTDDELWGRARRLNWEIVSERADRAKVREEILGYYRSLVS